MGWAAQPASLWNEIQQRGVLRIGTPGDYAPYSLRNAQIGHYSGADITLARELALQLGLRAEFLPTSWSGLLEDAASNRFDIAVGGISITPERSSSVLFSSAYFRDAKRPVVRCGEQQRYDTREEIDSPGVRLIVNPGGTNESFARREFPRASMSVHTGNIGVFDEIRAGRADVMVTDGVEADLQQHGGLCAVQIAERWAPADKAILVAADPALQRAVDDALRRLAFINDYARRLHPWQSDAATSHTVPSAALAALIDERLALVTEVARFKWNTGAAIEDLPREKALLDALRLRAQEMGLSEELTASFFSAQIAAAKQLQQELFERWRREGREKFPGVADLATGIRPALDMITGQMLDALYAAGGARALPLTLPAGSTIEGISPAALRMARAPLLAAGT